MSETETDEDAAAEAAAPTTITDLSDIEVPEVDIRQFSAPDEIDIDAIRMSYEEELEVERRKAGQRVAVVILVMMMIMIPLFASM